MENSDCFMTADLSVASYLFLNIPKIKFCGVKKDQDKSVYFIFKPLKPCRGLASKFGAGLASVDAKSFSQVIGLIKYVTIEELKEK